MEFLVRDVIHITTLSFEKIMPIYFTTVPGFFFFHLKNGQFKRQSGVHYNFVCFSHVFKDMMLGTSLQINCVWLI